MELENEQKLNTKDIAEGSIRKKFKKQLLTKFAKALNEYELLKENDHVMCCISGGKDSFLMAKLFQEIKRHNKFNFKLSFVSMDPGYLPVNRKLIEDNAKNLNIPLEIFDTDIFSTVYDIEQSPCYLCARMRRGYLYSYAQKIGANKIALGHHFDDVIETILMSIIFGGQVQNMPPKLKSANFEGLELIRPMYLIREEDIIKWKKYCDLTFLQCACKFTEECSVSHDENTSKRLYIKNLIKEIHKVNPYIDSNIFMSMKNVNLDTVIEYKTNNIRHNFLENY